MQMGEQQQQHRSGISAPPPESNSFLTLLDQDRCASGSSRLFCRCSCSQRNTRLDPVLPSLVHHPPPPLQREITASIADATYGDEYAAMVWKTWSGLVFFNVSFALTGGVLADFTHGIKDRGRQKQKRDEIASLSC